jgi:hypothetical protein
MKSRLFIGRIDGRTNDGRRRSVPRNVSISPSIQNSDIDSSIQIATDVDTSALFIGGNSNSRRGGTLKTTSVTTVIQNYYLAESVGVLDKPNFFIDGVSDATNDGSRRLPAYSTPDVSFINKSSMVGLLLPFGIISGSSQLTASLDIRYMMSASVNVDTYLDNHIFITSGSFGGH